MPNKPEHNQSSSKLAENWIQISSFPRADKPVLTSFELVLLKRYLLSILSYAKNAGEAPVISLPSQPENAQSRMNQKAVSELVRLGYLRIFPQQSLAVSGAEMVCTLRLTNFESQNAGDIEFTATGRIIPNATNTEVGYDFTVVFSNDENQTEFLKMLDSFGLDSTDDVAFTSSLALYLNIQYPNLLNQERFPHHAAIALATP